MKRLPRLLPLIAVAIAGVMAVNLLAGATSLPDLFRGARAWAQEAVTAPVEAATGEAAAPTLAAAADTAQVCAPTAAEFAEAAGLSPAELQVLQSLGQRRAELDNREDGMDVQLQLLTAAEAKLDAKAAELGTLIAQLETLLGEVDSQEAAEQARMVKVYETMAPKDAAPALAMMSDEVRLPLLARMKERNLAAILQKMTPAQAREVTEKLAQRIRQTYALDQARAAQAAAAPAPAAPAPAPASRPAQSAAAAPAPATAAAPG